MSIKSTQWVGWGLTIVLAAMAAVGSSSRMSARNTEKISTCEKRIDKIEIKQECQFEKVNNKLDCLLVKVIELKMEMPHKQDKR